MGSRDSLDFAVYAIVQEALISGVPSVLRWRSSAASYTVSNFPPVTALFCTAHAHLDKSEKVKGYFASLEQPSRASPDHTHP